MNLVCVFYIIYFNKVEYALLQLPSDVRAYCRIEKNYSIRIKNNNKITFNFEELTIITKYPGGQYSQLK